MIYSTDMMSKVAMLCVIWNLFDLLVFFTVLIFVILNSLSCEIPVGHSVAVMTAHIYWLFCWQLMLI